MKYYEIIRFCFIFTLFLGGLFVVYKSRLNIILSVNIHNNKQEIYLSIIYLFNIIKIKIPIYSNKKNNKTDKNKKSNKNHKNESKKENNNKKEKHTYGNKINKKDLVLLYKIIKKIKVKEFYSNIDFGNQNSYFTGFIYIFINIIYGNIGNIINADKMYLKINPNFTQTYMNFKFKVHISPRIEDLCKIIKLILKIYLNNKGGGQNESSRFDTKSYGDNS